MIKLQVADERFQRCESCHKKHVANITIKPLESNYARGFHLCNDCLFLMISKIKEYLNE